MPAKLNLIGQRFGHLVVIGQGEPIGASKKTTWLCDCDCGTKSYLARTHLLRRGETISCGCMKLHYSRQRKEKKDKNIGRKIGKFTVISKDPNNFEKYICKCDCGNTFTELQGNINKRKSCGCLPQGGWNAADLSGKKFGRLTAIKRVGSKSGKAVWLFQCDCGRMCETKAGYVLRGETQSCGCIPKGPEGWKYLAENPERAETDTSVYYVRVRDKYDKIGISLDVSTRSEDFTEIIYERVMPRASAIGVEAVALQWTISFAPEKLREEWDDWRGSTELRDSMDQQKTIEMLEQLGDECEDIGWRDFWKKYDLYKD